MILNTHKWVSVLQRVSRVVEINNMIPCLPCLKRKEESQANLSTYDSSFSGIGLCTVVLGTCPAQTVTLHYAEGNVFSSPTLML